MRSKLSLQHTNGTKCGRPSVAKPCACRPPTPNRRKDAPILSATVTRAACASSKPLLAGKPCLHRHKCKPGRLRAKQTAFGKCAQAEECVVVDVVDFERSLQRHSLLTRKKLQRTSESRVTRPRVSRRAPQLGSYPAIAWNSQHPGTGNSYCANRRQCWVERRTPRRQSA